MHVKNKALALVSLIILCLSGFFLFQGISRQNREIESMLAQEEKILDITIGNIERYALHIYRVKIKQLLENNPAIGAAFAERDRDVLYRRALPLYDDLREENEHFHAWDFNLPDGTVFLRVQKPELYGDDISKSRAIVQRVHESRKQQAGYDIGKHGAIYWVAQPVFHDGEYVGATEFGVPVRQLVDALRGKFLTEVATLVKASRWHRATFVDKGYRLFGDYVLMTHGSSAYSLIPDDFVFSPECDQEIVLEGRTHILHKCSVLRDFKGDPVGSILVLRDISGMEAERKRFIAVALALTGALFCASFAVLYVSFGALIGNLENYAEKNRVAREEVEEARSKLEVRVRERTADLRSINEAMQMEIAARAKVEEALRDSHERLLLVLDGLDANVYVADMESYDILFINKAAKENFGDIVGRKCWETIQSGQSGPCAFCTNRQLVDSEGNPAGASTWEFRNADQGKWYIIQDRAIRWADGKLVRLAIATDITGRKQAEEKIRASLREKEVLLKEIHHRVKNNMQIISSLLNLESAAAGAEGEKDIFRDSQSRIRAMALVHEKLYQSGDIANINFQDYIENMIRSLYALYDADRERIRPVIRAEGVALGIDTAIPCGLIINELVTNSLRHAFPEGRAGEIRISVRQSTSGDGGKKSYELIVRDDGVGVPASVSLHDAGTLGLQLVTGLAEHQLQGKAHLERNGGAAFSVRFRELQYKGRT
jgi:PAS domain S-box-containing protein